MVTGASALPWIGELPTGTRHTVFVSSFSSSSSSPFFAGAALKFSEDIAT